MGVLEFLTNTSSFQQTRCKQLRLLGVGNDANLAHTTNSSRQLHDVIHPVHSEAPIAIADTTVASSSSAAAATGLRSADVSYGVCWDVIAADIGAGSCMVFSVREAQTAAGSTRHLSIDASAGGDSGSIGATAEANMHYTFERALAEAGCNVHLFTDDKQSSEQVFSHANVQHHEVRLRAVHDPFDQVPVHTLEDLLHDFGHDR